MYIISACLCGVNCKYNGLNNYNKKCEELFLKGEAILVCPEQLGGLSTPRIPCELQDSSLNILNGNGIITNKTGEDVTENFIRGAKEVQEIAKKLNIKKAILKEGSPSCGVNYIYDGSFTGKKVMGTGITTNLLKSMGIDVISERELGGNIDGSI